MAHMTAPAPLDGISVVDFSRYLPGPFCTLQLAWLGAHVTMVEQPPAGDPMRHMPPLGPDGQSLASASLTRHKHSIILDLSMPNELDHALELCDGADVVVESFRPGVAARLGIGYDAIRARNPRIVYCSISGFGQTGPWAQVAGHDANYLATAGLLEQMGTYERANLPPVPLADLGGGSLAATAICAALWQRDRGEPGGTGAGTYIDLSLTEAALVWQPHSLPAAATNELNRAGGTLTGRLARYSIYSCADGRDVAVAAVEPKFFARVLQALELPMDLAAAQYDPERQAELYDALAAAFFAQPATHWHELLATNDSCVTMLSTPAEVEAHPQLRARSALDFLHGDRSMPAPASPFVYDGQRTAGAAAATSGHT
jgi:crotonobetainyl-CoA:carnitine CoA-transferase CaiB-like acyl-CoA transferase